MSFVCCLTQLNMVVNAFLVENVIRIINWAASQFTQYNEAKQAKEAQHSSKF